ncbi:MAG: putative phage protein [Anaerocolumna sp.]|nr:putative phage protein [Anaerocolumna sp.]
MTYEDLQKQHNNLYIHEMDLYEVKGLKGLYIDGCIAIDKNLTQREKGCILAEEIGHHLTSVGDILDQSNDNNRKQEYKARLVSYDIQIGLQGIIDSYEAGCTSLYSMAEFLDVTEDYLNEALDTYKNKYGVYVIYNEYIIYFMPCLGVLKRL